MSASTRAPCTCTAALQPCDACLRWDSTTRTRRCRPRAAVIPPAELRLRGLTHHYLPEATTPLLLPLAPLEVRWL
jgi:hypothetical protein